jgi:ATP-dependent helicase/nuclease subunit A
MELDIRSFDTAFLDEVSEIENRSFSVPWSKTSFEDSLKNQGSEHGGVQLVTIHSSKGLEYRVVFVSFLSQLFICQDEYKTMLFTPRLGPCTSVMRLGGKAKISPACKRALRRMLHKEMLEEEMRVFYVALTRAKEKLILTASVKDRRSLSLSLFRHPTAVEKRIRQGLTLLATSPRGLILPCLGDDPALGRVLDGAEEATENGFTVRFVTDLPDEAPYFASCEKAEAVQGDPEEVLRELSFVYSHKDEVVLPNKLSVSQLLTRSEEEEWGELYPTRLMDFDRGVLRTGAEKVGTATHQVMQFCDFAAMAKDPQGEMERLVTRGFLSAEDLGLVNRDQIAAFFRSELYKKLLASPAVEREKRFNVLLCGSDLGVGEGEVLVQGVVDAWFENPDGTLTILDFKTDRVKSENGEAVLRERHGHQLRLYALAVETMTGKKVSDLVLCSFALQKEVPVERGSGAKDS